MRTHKVKQGESISHIVPMYGVKNEDAIWSLPANKNLQNTKRKKDVLAEGDLVYIPDIKLKQVLVSSNQRYKFRRSGDLKQELEMQLFFEDKPRVNLACKLIINEVQIPRMEINSTTNSSGNVTFNVPISATTGVLIVGEDESYKIRFNYLDPVSELTGLQQRLKSLGYICEPSGELDSQTSMAIHNFQLSVGLNSTGEANEDTLKALEKCYGS